MVTVDLSNIWAHASLPELLALEGGLGLAHQTLLGLGDDTPPRWLQAPEVAPILQAAQTIRAQSRLCLVLAGRGLCLGPEGVIAALGRDKDAPELLFAGDSFGTCAHHALEKAVEGKDFSLILISPEGKEPEFAAAARCFRWLLERKYGTEEAARRIYAVTLEDSPLALTAREQGWQWFPFAGEEPFACVTARWLLPMAVAGVDIAPFQAGAAQVRELVNLQSFENPLWLSVAAGALMAPRGRETLAITEPGLLPFAAWWRHLLPGRAVALLPRDDLGEGLVTALRPEPPEQPAFLDADWKNRDGLGHLEGKPLDWLESALWDALAAQADRGCPVLTLACSPLDAGTLGELSAFFSLARALTALLPGEAPAAEPPYREFLPGLLGMENEN